MDDFFNLPAFGQWIQFGSRQFQEWLASHFYGLILVLIRFSGLMTTGPIFGQSQVPFRARFVLILALTTVIAPLTVNGSVRQFVRFDRDGDGYLTQSETPAHLQARWQRLAARRADIESGRVPINAFQQRAATPREFSQLLIVVASEFVLGMTLGLGAMIVLSGLQAAGQLVDQQLGLEFASVVNPELGGQASLSSNTFFMIGGLGVLLLEPIGGHMQLLLTVIESFDALPVGHVTLPETLPMLFSELVHKSLLFGVQVAAPVLAAMSLVSVCMGYLGHSVPQFNQLVVGFPVRAAVGLMVLAVTLSGLPRALIDAVPDAIWAVQAAVSV